MHNTSALQLSGTENVWLYPTGEIEFYGTGLNNDGTAALQLLNFLKQHAY